MSDKIPKDSDGAKLTGGPGAMRETSEARLSIKFFIWRRRSEWPGWLDNCNRVHQLRGRGGPKEFFLDKPERVTALKNQHAAEVIVWFLKRSQPSELEGSKFSTVQPYQVVLLHCRCIPGDTTKSWTWLLMQHKSNAMLKSRRLRYKISRL